MVPPKKGIWGSETSENVDCGPVWCSAHHSTAVGQQHNMHQKQETHNHRTKNIDMLCTEKHYNCFYNTSFLQHRIQNVTITLQKNWLYVKILMYVFKLILASQQTSNWIHKKTWLETIPTINRTDKQTLQTLIRQHAFYMYKLTLSCHQIIRKVYISLVTHFIHRNRTGSNTLSKSFKQWNGIHKYVTLH